MRTRSWKRRSLRRAVALDCALQSELWDGLVSLVSSNVSNEGMWLDTPYALEPGEQLVISFLPPGARQGDEVWAVAEVARIGFWRRRLDPWPAGMGLSFLYLSDVDRRFLARSLVGFPPRLPARRSPLPPPLPRSCWALPVLECRPPSLARGTARFDHRLFRLSDIKFNEARPAVRTQRVSLR